MTKPTAYQLACGHVERTATEGIIIELSRIPAAHGYSVIVFRRDGSMLGSYPTSRLADAWRYYRIAIAQVHAGKWY